MKPQDLYPRRGLAWLWHSSCYPPPTSCPRAAQGLRAEVRPLVELGGVRHGTSPCIWFWHQRGTRKHETEGVWWTHVMSSVYAHHDFQAELERKTLCLLFNNVFCIQVWLSNHLLYPLLLPKNFNILSLALVSLL